MTREQRRNPSSIARNSLVMTAGFTVTSGFMFLTDLAVIHAYGPTAHPCAPLPARSWAAPSGDR
ncbi:MAG: hypothetical protein ACYTE6_06935 [Planctomycetota bacterium]|jgi:hypothetical protein